MVSYMYSVSDMYIMYLQSLHSVFLNQQVHETKQLIYEIYNQKSIENTAFRTN